MQTNSFSDWRSLPRRYIFHSPFSLGHSVRPFALQKTAREFPKVVQVGRFLELNVTCLTELLSRDDIQVLTEYDVAQSAVHWLEHAYEQRQAYIQQVMSCVRCPLMTSKELMTLVRKAGFLMDDDAVKHSILESNWYRNLVESGHPPPSSYAVPRPRSSLLNNVNAHGSQEVDSVVTASMKPVSIRLHALH